MPGRCAGGSIFVGHSSGLSQTAQCVAQTDMSVTADNYLICMCAYAHDRSIRVGGAGLCKPYNTAYSQRPGTCVNTQLASVNW